MYESYERSRQQASSRRRNNWRCALSCMCAAAALVLASGAVRDPPIDEQPIGAQADGSILVSTGQQLTPAGNVKPLSLSRPKGLALSPDSTTLAVLTQNSVVFYDTMGNIVGTVLKIPAGPLGICWAPDGSAVFAAEADGKVARIEKGDSGWHRSSELIIDTVGADGAPDVAAGTAGQGLAKRDPQVTGLAAAADGRRLFVAMGIRNAVAVVDARTGKAEQVIPVGVSPYHLRLSPDGKTLAVACRGGERPAAKDEASAPSAGTDVRVDEKTDASLAGAISLIDIDAGAAATFPAGRQPSGMAFSASGATLYAASSDDDTVLEVDVPARKVRRTIALMPKSDTGFGQMPTDVAVSADAKTLFVALGGANAIGVIDIGTGQTRGYIPTAWYPLAIDQRNGAVVVACTKGFGSRIKAEASEGYGVHNTVGIVEFISPADTSGSRLESLSQQVALNNKWSVSERGPGIDPAPNAVPIPADPKQPSSFKHVVYIIKENQSYDGVLGDMPEGNGDPKLCTFPEDVTPNEHALSREFVLLDNTYASGTNSADGHQWVDSGLANAYTEQNYAANARSYPYDGGDPLAYSPQGFLWTAARAAKKSVRVYGEFVNKPRIRNRTTGKSGASWSQIWADYKRGMPTYEITSDTDNAALKPYLHPNYIGFPTSVPDQWRADQFIADIDKYEHDDNMPDLCLMLLPCDHTSGRGPGGPTPRATVADNDFALGRIVERLSHSKFWPYTLILVIEDDSQFGLDHVDGHRTFALCVSPYTRRGVVVHHNYNHVSFLKTIELVLGLQPMSRFDRTAVPLSACFTNTPDMRSYKVRPNKIPLDELNPPYAKLSAASRNLARASARQDWSHADRADAEIVARANWDAQRPGEAFPSSAFHPPADGDEDNREASPSKRSRESQAED